MLPRQVARGLKGKKCYEVLSLNICKDRCIAQQCWQEKKQVRLDEIDGHPAGSEKEQRFILSAVPILDETGNPVGALEIQRDVTDEAEVQVKYQEMPQRSYTRRQELREAVERSFFNYGRTLRPKTRERLRPAA